jgi:mRNA-degrading endonuclease RelE of RelBE toxin-antitoxin system
MCIATGEPQMPESSRRKWKLEFTDQALKDIASLPDDVKRELTKVLKEIQENPQGGRTCD